MNLRVLLETRLLALWHEPVSGAAWLLRPLERGFVMLARWRRLRQTRSAQPLPVPVVVVGNISVGGTGKTPLVIALAQLLNARGLRVGIVSRGHGGSAYAPLCVVPDSDPRRCGDEALLMAARSTAAVWVGRDRARTARALLAAAPVDVILADDGLQHYRLARTMEICVVDATRGLGNGHCLPLGPLREPPARLDEVSYVILNGSAPAPPGVNVQGRMRVRPALWRRVHDDSPLALQAVAAGERVHAVAGIGNPQRFFALLRTLGVEPIEHPFADHHCFRAEDLRFGDTLRVVMTEKDAVKCRHFAAPDWLALGIEAQLPDSLGEALLLHVASDVSRSIP